MSDRTIMSCNEWGTISPMTWELLKREQERLNRQANLFLDNAKWTSGPVLRFRRWPFAAKPTVVRLSASASLDCSDSLKISKQNVVERGNLGAVQSSAE